ncbi:small subunit methyltransferase H [Seminavis robusta]|uniref:Small subunit methyltransferase H n=1 Tax=Seminavis robusta TaxID=568900 RepID=A0A9N8EXD4_9STRA|nr:small subunit methyltransferase H [Seminavis robusta]|eukprot:Sro2148_g316540.1 small subunit methyltransferase H (469) ;mRNA; f:2604-4010
MRLYPFWTAVAVSPLHVHVLTASRGTVSAFTAGPSYRSSTRRMYSSSTKIPTEQQTRQDDNEDGDDDLFSATATSSSLPFASTYHAPVMWKECIEGLLGCQRARQRQQLQEEDDDSDTSCSREPLFFVDGTLGGGGHSEALLQQLKPGDVVFGCDVDFNALQTASQRLEAYMNNPQDLPLFVPVQCNFAQLAQRLPQITTTTANDDDTPLLPSLHSIDGILLDFGVSSHQIDTPERGFAFMAEGPLDMRMSTSSSSSDNTQQSQSSLTAADLVNELQESDLTRILKQFGDEPRARAIAKSILNNRPLVTTTDLQQAVADVVPAFDKRSKRKGRTATCARVFQALRIVVNQEDLVLQRVLEEACPQLLRPGGRLVVLSYHSMEDRATKRIMRDGTIAKVRASSSLLHKDMYGNWNGPPKPFRPVGKFQKASEQEVALNSRARSATLRIAERLEVVVDSDEEEEDTYGRP